MSTERPTCEHCDKVICEAKDESGFALFLYKLIEFVEMDEDGDFIGEYMEYNFCSWDCLANWVHERDTTVYRIHQSSFRGICSECGQTVTCPITIESRIALTLKEEGELFEHKCPSCNQLSAFKIITKNA